MGTGTLCERASELEVVDRLLGLLQDFLRGLKGFFILIVSYSLYSGPAVALTCRPAVSFGQ